MVGLLHDVDFELYPDEHCLKGVELLQNEDMDESIIHATMSHGFGIVPTPHEPTHIMEKILFAVDELTGLIGAAALTRPSKSVSDMELSNVKKKFKDKMFAAGCSRDVIIEGAERLGWSLDELITATLDAIKVLIEGKKVAICDANRVIGAGINPKQAMYCEKPFGGATAFFCFQS